VSLLAAAAVAWPADAFAQEAPPAPQQTAASRARKKAARKGPQPIVAFPGGLVWQTQLPALPDLAPSFDGTRGFVALNNGTLACVALDTGEITWTVQQAASVPPTASGDVVVGAAGSHLWAREAQSGTLRWERSLPAAAAAAPLINDGTVVVALASGLLVGLTADGGKDGWQVPLGAPPATPLARFRTLALAGLTDGRVVATDVASGRIAWQQTLTALLTLSVVGQRAFAGARDNFVYVLDAQSGRLRWQWRTGGDPIGDATDDTVGIYHVSRDNTLRAHHRRTGDLLWKSPIPSRATGGPVSVGDRLVVGGVAKELRAFASVNGTAAGVVGLPGRLLHRPHLLPPTDTSPGRLIVLVSGGAILSLGETIEPPLVPLVTFPGHPLRAEVASRIVGGSSPGSD